MKSRAGSPRAKPARSAPPPDEAAARADLREILRRAGTDGAPAGRLRLQGKSALCAVRRAVLAKLVESGAAGQAGAAGSARYFAVEFLPSAASVAARLVELGTADADAGTPPFLWKAVDLRARLPAHERPLLDAALDHLQAAGEVVPLRYGRSLFVAFAAPVRGWLATEASAQMAREAASEPSAAAVDDDSLFAAYERLVRESGGFPDVKIARLRHATGDAPLGARLAALWREGVATLSRGDWSLADEAARADAVELDGQKYLLVRFER